MHVQPERYVTVAGAGGRVLGAGLADDVLVDLRPLALVVAPGTGGQGLALSRVLPPAPMAQFQRVTPSGRVLHTHSPGSKCVTELHRLVPVEAHRHLTLGEILK